MFINRPFLSICKASSVPLRKGVPEGRGMSSKKGFRFKFDNTPCHSVALPPPKGDGWRSKKVFCGIEKKYVFLQKTFCYAEISSLLFIDDVSPSSNAARAIGVSSAY